MRVFLDANVLFSASNSATNIARVIAWTTERETAVTSDLAIEEARKNLLLKRPTWLPAFEDMIGALEIAPSVLFELPVSIVTKDAPLLCAAIRSRCHLLVTGDQRVGIALKIREPLAEEAKKRQGTRTDIEPKSPQSYGRSTEQAAKQTHVGNTAVKEMLAEQEHNKKSPTN